MNPTAKPSATPRILRRWQAVVLALLVVAGGAAIYSSTRSRTEVRVVSPTVEDIESTVLSTGTVIPVDDFPARANFSGIVEGIFVHLGQKVHAGQMLLKMKDQYAVPRVENARAALDDAEVNEQNVEENGSQEDRIGFAADQVKAQAERDQAANALAAMEQIEKNGSVTGAEVEAAKQRLQAAEATLRALQQRVTNRYSPADRASWRDRVAADKASLEAEKVSWANANISTPIGGTVYALPVSLYDFVPAGTALLSVADLSKIEIRADFDEADIGKLKIGQPVTVTWDGQPGKSWHGHLDAKPLAVTRSGDRSVGRCTIALEDNHGDLPIDTQVAVSVVVDKHHQVLTIPREALHTEGAAHFVYRVVDGKLKRTPVDTGLANAMTIEITRGLRTEDVIALHAMNDQKLADNLRVATVR